MDPDVALVVGTFLAVVSIPSLISALADRRLPWAGLFSLIAGAAMIFWIYRDDIFAFLPQHIPEAFVRVIARYIY